MNENFDPPKSQKQFRPSQILKLSSENRLSQQVWRIIRWVGWSSYGVVLLIAAVVGTVIGLIFGYSFDLSEVTQLESRRPDVISYVYSDDGRTIGQFAIERRIIIGYQQIPLRFKQAIIATEDQNFFKHSGIDFYRLARAALEDIFAWKKAQGASTLTQQLSKLRLTSSEKTFERKIKDALFALQIEKHYSKEQILTFYCNQIYMGHGNYGIAAAADFYFSKTPDQLSLAECALLAGMARSAIWYSPILHPDRALARRNLVLRRMQSEKYVSESLAEKTMKEPIVLNIRVNNNSVAPYFVEMVRQSLEEDYNTDQIWRSGLQIYSTIDYDMQVVATEALHKGLRAFDKQKGWRGPQMNILESGNKLDSYVHPDWSQNLHPGMVINGLVLDADKDYAEIKIGAYRARVGSKEIAWTKRKSPAAILRQGDICAFEIHKIDPAISQLQVTLDQMPEVQGAMVAIDNSTGEIKTMVGGYDFGLSKFNRATQALRQTGSIFKPIVYSAALEEGFKPDDIVLDAPISFGSWSPHNYDNEYKGPITIRKALAESRNLPAVRIASKVGIKNIIGMAHRFGITSEFQPYLPIALGANEVTLLEMTSAFSTFPNNGIRVKPYFIRRVEDYNGLLLQQHSPKISEVLSANVACDMLSLLQGVVQFGTSTRAQVLGRPLGGKTGTTNDCTDSWFIGFTPSMTAGTWTGYDTKKSLGPKVTGAVLALPIWIDFMQRILKGRPVEQFPECGTKREPSKVAAAKPNAAEQTSESVKPKPAVAKPTVGDAITTSPSVPPATKPAPAPPPPPPPQ
ncbi:MAG TPA: PBP1A family penicillin-binding protein [Acidobacteriota bacterium]|nr:PBP1A family penicillin-binding protein [Acidobacteriota bacterium]